MKPLTELSCYTLRLEVSPCQIPLFAQLSEHVYYLPGAVNCAVVVNGGEAVLIDTGGDKDYGRALA